MLLEMVEKRYIVHLVQPVSKSTIGGADMHVLDLVTLQKKRSDIIPIVCIRWNESLRSRIESIGVQCFCGEAFSSSIMYILWLRKELARYRISIFHSHGYDANFQYVALRVLTYSKFHKAKFVITSHGWIENTLFLKFKTKLDFMCHYWADAHIVCASKNLRRLRDGALHYCVLNGVLPFCCNRNIETIVRVGFVGRLSSEKRPDIFVEIAKRVVQSAPAVFYIFGEGGESERLKEMIASNNLNEIVFLKGQHSDRSYIFSNIDILVLPSDTESTPRVAIEALLCGIPVVATDVGDVASIVLNNCGYVARKGDVIAMSEYVLKLVTDISLRESMGENGRRHARDSFSAPKMEQSIYEIYKNLL